MVALIGNGLLVTYAFTAMPLADVTAPMLLQTLRRVEGRGVRELRGSL